jgi:hypothetical protein
MFRLTRSSIVSMGGSYLQNKRFIQVMYYDIRLLKHTGIGIYVLGMIPVNLIKFGKKEVQNVLLPQLIQIFL